MAILAAVAGSQPATNNPLSAYTVSAGLVVIGLLTLVAAVKNYRGSYWFVTGTLASVVAVVFISIVCDGYRRGDSNMMTGGILVASLLSLLAALLFWLGHRRHARIHSPVAEDSEPESVAQIAETAEAAIPSLYPPMQNWRVFLLMLFSATLYSCFLMYRIARDLQELGEKQLSPKHCAWQMLVPLYNFSVFLRIAKRVARLSRAKAIAVKVSPVVLLAMLIAANIGSVVMPPFLFLLNCSFVAIPWLILHGQMNRLRGAQAADWREPPDRYSWRQRGVFLAGVPLIVLALIGNKSEFAYYTAERLAAEQTVSGQPASYSLTIPDRQWRQVANGTLYPDTDLELLNKSLNEWVVVRVNPSERQTLDAFIDQRQALIAANWKSFDVDETRGFASGTELIPLSLARYTQKGTVISRDSPLFVATLVTSEQVFEVIGHGPQNPASSAWELVKSFRLLAGENKS